MTQRLQIVILLVLTVTIYVATAARPSLLDDADSPHAMAAQAMLDRGDWAVLHMNGIAWLEKPPVHFWLVAASFAGQRQEALLRLPPDRAYFVAERGGKALFVNQPLEPGQLSLEALVARSKRGALPGASGIARNQPRDAVGERAVAVEQALSAGGAAR